MKNVRIERVQLKDVKFFSQVAVKAYADHYLHLWEDGGRWYMQKYFSEEKFAEELKDENSCFYIAFFDDAPVGFLKVNINAPINGFTDKSSLELERIYLNKEVTGMGIGRKLVELTFDIAKKNNKDFVRLKAMDTSNAVIAFYKKMGFQIEGVHRLKHPLMKDELRGMVIMVKKLREQQK